MSAMSLPYVHLVGGVGLLTFWYLSYRWIQRKRAEDPLPPWLRSEVRRQQRRTRLQRQYGVIEGEEWPRDLTFALFGRTGQEAEENNNDYSCPDYYAGERRREEEIETPDPEVNPLDAEGLTGLAREAYDALKKALLRYRSRRQARCETQ
uniref:ORFL103C_(VMIA) n=1 Tax=Panine betaherpesvirus 2 TaxID=188763 RepID=A0A8F7PNW1_9BETA|nr:ORFL103C_(vMIA) [Panine betaherpesvirus 2]